MSFINVSKADLLLVVLRRLPVLNFTGHDLDLMISQNDEGLQCLVSSGWVLVSLAFFPNTMFIKLTLKIQYDDPWRSHCCRRPLRLFVRLDWYRPTQFCNDTCPTRTGGFELPYHRNQCHCWEIFRLERIVFGKLGRIARISLFNTWQVKCSLVI